MTNQEIAQEINNRIGNSPVPFDSVYSIALEIYQELGGEESQFDSVYSILLETLNVIDSGISAKVIDDSSISLTKTWSSSKISTELADAGFDVEIVTELPSVGDPHTIYFILKQDSSVGDVYDEWMYIDGNWEMVGNTQIDLSDYATIDYVDEKIEAVIGAANSEIEGKQTEDFTFVQTLPVSGEEDQLVIIKGDNTDNLYKYVSGAWVEQTPDANKLYFDVENEALYSYVTANHQFAPVSLVNTIVVGSNLNNNADLKALKTPGVYSVVQRLHNATKGDYVKNWTLYVESVDYEEYDRSDSVYQRLVSNYTIQKRTWSATRATNDGWSSFSTYYAGEIKDSTVSKYYTWSSNKLNASLGEIDEKISNVKPIEEVSELPEASENKDKLFRLDNGDKDVYVAKLLSSETITTNRLPDAQQIDKAYLYEGKIYYYSGIWTLICNDGEVKYNGWFSDSGEGNYDLTITIDNAENISSSSNAATYDIEWTFDIENKTISSVDYSISDIESALEYTLEYFGSIPIPAIYNAPESAQIGNAYANGEGDNYMYTNETVTDNGVTYHLWKYAPTDTDGIVSVKPASEIYFTKLDDEYETLCIDEKFYWYKNSTVGEEITIVNIYIPQLNAPDSEQVDNAYAYNEDIDVTYLYKGQTTVYFTDGTLDLYLWKANAANIVDIFSKYPASQQYNIEDVYGTTNDNELGISYDSVQNKYVSSTKTVSEAEEIISGLMFDEFETVELHNIIKYQRTETTTEEWGWQPLTDNATNDDIDAMFNEIKLIRAQEDDENYIDWLVNTGGETMVFNGQTYYKWAVWCNDFNDGSGPAEEHPNMVVLTNTLNVQLPFNSDSPEFEYRISIDGEEMISRNYIHGDYTQKTVQ